MAYKKLADAMLQHGVSLVSVAKHIDTTVQIASMKLTGLVPFTLEEARRIRDLVEPLASIDLLFEPDGIQPTEREMNVANVDALRGIIERAGLMDEGYDLILREMREEAIRDEDDV